MHIPLALMLVLGITFALAGLAVIIWASRGARRAREFDRRSAVVSGQITDLRYVQAVLPPGRTGAISCRC